MTTTDSALRYGAIVFDLDGTLVDSYAALAESVNFARREHGLPELLELRIREFVGDGLDRLLQRAFEQSDVPASVVAAFEARYDEICCSESRVLEEVEETVRALGELEVSMAVCTNKPTGFSRKILHHLRLSQYFQGIVGPDLAGARKPDARHVNHALQAMGRTAKESLFVGDMPIDVEAARNSGMDVAVIPTGSSTLAVLRAARADHYLNHFSDLLTIVRNGERE